MKKKIAILAAALLLMSMLSACGKDDSYLSGINASKYVTLGEYKGIEVTEAEFDVDVLVDYYIDTYILAPKAVTTEVTDRTVVEEGDTVNIDYTGYRDGVAFENGSAQGDSLTIGSGRFIPGFEEGLIGTSIGDTVTLELTFPEDYKNNPDLAGAAVSFEVTINGISIIEMPELTDEIAQEQGIEGCTTADELRDYVYAYFEDMYNKTIISDITNAVMANCIFKDPPEKMVDRYYNSIVEEMTAEAFSYGLDLNTYMYYNNMDEATYTEIFEENAVTSAQQYIMYQAIADAEGLNLSEEEVSQAMEERVAKYGYESVEEFKEQTDMETFREYLMAEKVRNFLVENAVITNE